MSSNLTPCPFCLPSPRSTPRPGERASLRCSSLFLHSFDRWSQCRCMAGAQTGRRGSRYACSEPALANVARGQCNPRQHFPLALGPPRPVRIQQRGRGPASDSVARRAMPWQPLGHRCAARAPAEAVRELALAPGLGLALGSEGWALSAVSLARGGWLFGRIAHLLHLAVP